ncbi:MAG: hypothetical protein II859_13340 [Bacteroidales bacterium]|nr:hypothetical protein [Bacteroidales bacterium]
MRYNRSLIHDGLLMMVVILFTSIAFSFKLHAQRVFAPYYDDKDARFLYWDSCRKDYLLVKDYDFGCLYIPGIEKPDYGYSYSHKTHKLTLVECKTFIDIPGVRLNPDGSAMIDSAGNPIFEEVEKVKTKRRSIKLPDSLAAPLTELYRLAVKTARPDTCVSDEPPILDGWGWSFYSGAFPGGVANDPFRHSCSNDTVRNVQRFNRIHFSVEKAVREGNVKPIVKVMPVVWDLIEAWGGKTGGKSEKLSFADKIKEVRYVGNVIPIEDFHVKEERKCFEVACKMSYGRWKVKTVIPEWLVRDAESIEIWIVPDRHDKTPYVDLTRWYNAGTLPVGVCVQCQDGATGHLDIYFNCKE